MRRLLLGSCIAAISLTSTAAFAAPINIISEAKNGVVSPTGNAVSSSNDLVAIGTNSAWKNNDPLGRGAVWVSNADTGQGGGTFQDRVFTEPSGDADGDVIFTIEETFSVSTPSTITFSVWADDTARVRFGETGSETSLKDPNFTQDTCADGSIGCEDDEFFSFSENLTAGNYSILLDTYQIGTGTDTTSNPFGILYSGVVVEQETPAEVPAPATLGLLGAGLIGLGALARRRSRV